MRTGYDFEENNKKYNNETFFNFDIILEKTCYYQGEIMKGKIKLVPKDLLKKSFFINSMLGYATLEEIFNYELTLNDLKTSENNLLFKYPINIPKFNNETIVHGIEIPFEYVIPIIAYPSVILDTNSYVRHVLTFDFPTIETKKSTIIIIKNNQYFSFLNELYKAPAEIKIKTGKHKLGFFYKGEMSAKIKLFKNAFAYNEPIPLTFDIDCSNLEIKLKQITISIIIIIKKNKKTNHNISVSEIEKKILEKSIPLPEQRKEYHLEDIIQLPKDNPNDIYKKLDSDKRLYSEKFKDINLYPACYKGLITCEYFLKITLENDTFFSTNEYSTIQLDFYENQKKGIIENIRKNDNTPMSNNFNNNINIINNESENNNNFREFDAPPSVNINK